MSLICMKYFKQYLAHSKCFLSVSYYNYLVVMLEDNLEFLSHHKYRHYSPDCNYAFKTYISSLCHLLDTVSESEPFYF